VERGAEGKSVDNHICLRVNNVTVLEKLSLCCEGVCGSGCIDPRFLELRSRWR
jgi:hypothetical protein